jgi:hypothetical protein
VVKHKNKQPADLPSFYEKKTYNGVTFAESNLIAVSTAVSIMRQKIFFSHNLNGVFV